MYINIFNIENSAYNIEFITKIIVNDLYSYQFKTYLNIDNKNYNICHINIYIYIYIYIYYQL